MKSKAGPSSRNLESVEAAEKFLGHSEAGVVGMHSFSDPPPPPPHRDLNIIYILFLHLLQDFSIVKTAIWPRRLRKLLMPCLKSTDLLIQPAKK